MGSELTIKQLNPMDEARKRDAMALAELLLDIYKESKIKESPNVDKGESHEKSSTQRQRPKRIQKDK